MEMIKDEDEDEEDDEILKGGESICQKIRFHRKNDGGGFIQKKITPLDWEPQLNKNDPFSLLRRRMRKVCMTFNKFETFSDTLLSRGIPSNKALIALFHTNKFSSLPYANKVMRSSTLIKPIIKMNAPSEFINMTLLCEFHKFFKAMYRDVDMDDFVPEEIRKYKPFQEHVEKIQQCDPTKKNVAYAVWFFNQIELDQNPSSIVRKNNINNHTVADVNFTSETSKYLPSEGHPLMSLWDPSEFEENVNDFNIRYMVAKMKYQEILDGVSSIFMKDDGTPWLNQQNMFAPMEDKEYYGADILETVLQLPYTECVRKYLDGTLIVTDEDIQRCRWSPREILNMVLKGSNSKKQVYSVSEKEREAILTYFLKNIPRFPPHRHTLNYANLGGDSIDYADTLIAKIKHELCHPRNGKPRCSPEFMESFEMLLYEVYYNESVWDINDVKDDDGEYILPTIVEDMKILEGLEGYSVNLPNPPKVDNLSKDDVMHVLRHVANLDSKEGSLCREILKHCQVHQPKSKEV